MILRDMRDWRGFSEALDFAYFCWDAKSSEE